MIKGPRDGDYSASHVVCARTKIPCDCYKRRFKGKGRVVERLLPDYQHDHHWALPLASRHVEDLRSCCSPTRPPRSNRRLCWPQGTKRRLKSARLVRTRPLSDKSSMYQSPL